MDVLDNKTDRQLAEVIVKEAAKSLNEIKCAQRDIDKASSRIQFLLVIANKLLERSKG